MIQNIRPKSILVSAPLGNHLTPLLKRLGRWSTLDVSDVQARRFQFMGTSIYLHKSGFGRRYAVQSVLNAIEVLSPDHVVYIGVAGGLKPDFNVGDPFYIASASLWSSDSENLSIDQALGLDLQYQSQDMPLLDRVKGGNRVRRARLLSVDSFVNSVREKRKLGIAGYDLVDMEFAALAGAIRQAGAELPPLTGLMTVSDTVHHGFPSFKPNAVSGSAGGRYIPPKLKLNMNKAAQSLGSFVHLWLRSMIVGAENSEA